MKKNKVLACLAVAAMVTGLASCGGGEKELLILVPSADHGWTGAVLTNARDYAAELNESGEYVMTPQYADLGAISENGLMYYRKMRKMQHWLQICLQGRTGVPHG